MRYPVKPQQKAIVRTHPHLAVPALRANKNIKKSQLLHLSLVYQIRGNALFRREEDLTAKMKKEPFEVTILFLEDEK